MQNPHTLLTTSWNLTINGGDGTGVRLFFDIDGDLTATLGEALLGGGGKLDCVVKCAHTQSVVECS